MARFSKAVPILLATLLCTLLCTGLASSLPASAETYAFKGVHVLDATGAELQRDRAVVIRDDRIVRIVASSTLDAKSVDRVIDATGKVMIPGMWNLHVHVQEIGEPQLALFVAHGVTGVRDMGGEPALTFGYRDRIEKGELVGPRIRAAGYMITTPSIFAAIEQLCTEEQWEAEKKRRLVVSTPEEAKTAVRKIHESGGDLVKLHWNESPATYAAIASESKKLGLHFSGHDPLGAVTIDQWIEHGQHSIEHIDGSFAVQLSQRSPEQQAEWIERAAKSELHFVPTLLLVPYLSSLNDARTPPAKLERVLEHPEAAYAPERLREFWNVFFQMIPPAFPGIEAYRPQIELLERFHSAGIGIMPGTDLGVPLVFPGWSLADELALFVELLGMTPNEAVQSATRVPAEFFGLESDLGTIEPGKIADLVLLGSNPLDSIENLRDVQDVVRSGRHFDRAALDKLLRAARVTEASESR